MEDYLKGRGAQLNTANRFLKQRYEEEPSEVLQPSPQTQFIPETPKKIISTFNSPDLPMGKSINPYQGCEHGCIYCYARNSHEYWGYSAGLDFETKIMVKRNAAQLLEEQFRKAAWVPTPIELSGNTDCYQPAERKFELTRSLLKVFAKYRNPVSMITKNALILRDLDVLSELAAHQLVHVYISITTLNEELRQTMEPRTVTAQKRLQVIERLTAAGVPVGVMTAPIIPGLNDHEIPKLIEAAANAGALTAALTVVRLNGAIGELFEDWIRKTFPDRADKVLNQIRDCHGGQLNDSRWNVRMMGQGKIAEHIHQLHRISRQRYMPNRQMPAYDLTQFRREGMQMKLF
ncbi:radical SAM protein [Siphonobacter sp. BAB-5385]|uniref:PA0069 family radical SAM protein n=1 Tax=Siphonobacter sp. BAB-5385 TaxID=1864822 RepID=UPI000B9EA4BD|nr:PA0069 family radical SAM protein [Siphonobacter sp. BAB-5385]OZI09507.1 radical SAM protein [Siphonobacter sp. BAB-5385]